VAAGFWWGIHLAAGHIQLGPGYRLVVPNSKPAVITSAVPATHLVQTAPVIASGFPSGFAAAPVVQSNPLVLPSAVAAGASYTVPPLFRAAARVVTGPSAFVPGVGQSKILLPAQGQSFAGAHVLSTSPVFRWNSADAARPVPAGGVGSFVTMGQRGGAGIQQRVLAVQGLGGVGSQFAVQSGTVRGQGLSGQVGIASGNTIALTDGAAKGSALGIGSGSIAGFGLNAVAGSAAGDGIVLGKGIAQGKDIAVAAGRVAGNGILVGDDGTGHGEFIGSGTGSGTDISVLEGTAVGRGISLAQGQAAGAGITVDDGEIQGQGLSARQGSGSGNGLSIGSGAASGQDITVGNGVLSGKGLYVARGAVAPTAK